MNTSEMSVSNNEILHFIRQFFQEENFTRTMHSLEQEATFHFDKKHFEELVLKGEWDDAEKYLLAFTSLGENEYSLKMFYELRKQKLLEALEMNDRTKGLEIILKDLRAIGESFPGMLKEMTSLLTMEDFRQHESLVSYVDRMTERKRIIDQIIPLIDANPDIQSKTQLPNLGGHSELRRILGVFTTQVNYYPDQLYLVAETPIPQPYSSHVSVEMPAVFEPALTLLLAPPTAREPDIPLVEVRAPRFEVGSTSTSNVVRRPLGTPLVGVPNSHFEVGSSSTSNVVARRPRTSRGGVRNHPLSLATTIATRGNRNMAIINTAIGLSSTTPANELVSLQPSNTHQDVRHNFPTTLRLCVRMHSDMSCMDFHPLRQTVLLVGSIAGEVELWNIPTEMKVFSNGFSIWKQEGLSDLLLHELRLDPHISVKRVLWSPQGCLFGAALSKSLVQLYSYNPVSHYIQKHLEINAHIGGVNDLAFTQSIERRVFLITCGDDTLIQVWNPLDGTKHHTLHGHTAPVYSLTPYTKARETNKQQYLLSTSTNGEIKRWLLNEAAPRVQYETPLRACMRMVFSSDGKRLFSCGTNSDGVSFLVEWKGNNEGYLNRFYQGLNNTHGELASIPQMATIKNQFLVVGDDHLLKVWNMDNDQMLDVFGGDQSLPARPYLCFNKSGSLLAIFCGDGRIKVLANEEGVHLLTTPSLPAIVGPNRCLSSNLIQEMTMTMSQSEIMKLLLAKRIPKVLQIKNCTILKLQSVLKATKYQICRMEYTHSGNGLLALSGDGIHILWKWPIGNELSSVGKASPTEVPEHWKPNGIDIVNDLGDQDHPLLPTFHYMAIAKNDSYVATTSGRSLCLHNLMTFVKIRCCRLSPPRVTCIAFYPGDNNIMAVGAEDSSICIYNVRLVKVTDNLSGHKTRITGLAFSTALKVLISAAADAEIMMWDCSTWQRRKNISLNISVGWLPSNASETTVQFHRDQKNFIAVHETQVSLFEASNLTCRALWVIGNFSARIRNGVYNADNKIVYTLMKDGIVMLLCCEDLTPKMMIDPPGYLPFPPMPEMYAVVIAAHPQKANQFAVGLSDGSVVIVEPGRQMEGRVIPQAIHLIRSLGRN